jgi:hypothetical protein
VVALLISEPLLLALGDVKILFGQDVIGIMKDASAAAIPERIVAGGTAARRL